LKDKLQKNEARGKEIFAIGAKTNKPANDSHPSQQQPTGGTVLIDDLQPPPAIDNRKDNRGSAKRVRHSNEFKWNQLESLEIWQESQKRNNQPATVAEFCKKFHPNDQSKWKNFYSQWSKKKDDIAKSLADEKYKHLKTITRGKQGKTPYKDMEDKLYKLILEDRKNNRKVSQLSIKTRAKKILNKLDQENGTSLSLNFKASNGWFWSFF
jgi:Tc5 transposase DNA-binding domain